MSINIKSIVVMTAACLALCLEAQPERLDQEATRWVREALLEIETVKVGMNRGQLLSLFITEGGLSTGLRRTYVYRKCPNIKVDVQFEPVGRAARDAEGRVTLGESEQDVITQISRPYLAWGVSD